MILAYIRDLRHRLLDKPAVIRFGTYTKERTNVFRICHSEYQWRKARNLHILVEPVCQACGDDKKLQVHHVEPWHLCPERRYDPTNLITLCQPDHFRFGHLRNWKNWNSGIKELCKHIRTQLKHAKENMV